jgi:hypothetical protein
VSLSGYVSSVDALRQLLSEVQETREPEGGEPAEDFTVLGTSPTGCHGR